MNLNNEELSKKSQNEAINSLSKNISIICPSPKGKEIALKLKESFNGRLYIKENNPSQGQINNWKSEINTFAYGEDFSLKTITKEAMNNSEGIIFISSTGIAVRAIAPFLEGKDKDPGIVVVDLSCKYAINILSGHLGGGNELTYKVSEILNSMPIITTASDNLGLIAPDILAKENNLIIEDLKKAKYMAALLINKKIIGIKDDYNIIKISNGYEKIQYLREDCIWITHCLKSSNNEELEKTDYSKILRLIKKDIVLGIGCRKGTTYEKLYDFVNANLIKYNLDIRAVSCIVSVDIKANEEGIIELAERINCPFKTFSKDEIKTVQDKYDKSEFVFKTLGITGVCEPSVDLAGAEVIISKIKHEGMTLAIGVLKNILE
ncbi:cobalt-precorrin 5A hydrolase [Clostridium beijerinckii]|uniref:Cobalamin biosynthesis protein CbiG n=1 Tax=Clostridium beijerinckii TaxID=1520 RepID=A0A1S9N8C5_CLOBE|nr:cobalt-precorrin 5A hydrolase [Clostridium beijerinckii]MZK51015.1 cobalt-precorrin 5A hydrolase [Clostridium beijerinckii]MZK59217.1 cobalt-precorrin 5A hydrolase [Clostridium beijerinckii]MZK69336.1 cobalt-precorrin 5A hydrolase [Clostridium beijerinckii]MZK74709.1 cobalt-precorrin 5A hydrolase [Clostridium beijerinckii]MZK84428.1 cobalt-precorrin 5A hydrolase [Clostridium beijerinckii]